MPLTPAPAVGYSGAGFFVAGFGLLWRVLKHEKARVQIVLVAFVCVGQKAISYQFGRRKEKYGGSTVRWIKESVVPNLKSWGFNTVGWVQEVTVKQWRHSRPFTNDEYQALRMPYCHLLP